jgi:pilus assembly protein Flp/PilA
MNSVIDTIFIKPYRKFRGGDSPLFIILNHPDYPGEIMMLYVPDEKGQGLVEYALILILVAVAVVVILALLGPAIGNTFSNVVSMI